MWAVLKAASEGVQRCTPKASVGIVNRVGDAHKPYPRVSEKLTPD